MDQEKLGDNINKRAIELDAQKEEQESNIRIEEWRSGELDKDLAYAKEAMNREGISPVEKAQWEDFILQTEAEIRKTEKRKAKLAN